MASSPTADDLGGRSVFIALPVDALVVLVGIAGAGKTTFAARHFAPTQVLSSDAMRALVADSPTAQGATDDAFEILHRLLEMRLRRGRLTVVAFEQGEVGAERPAVVQRLAAVGPNRPWPPAIGVADSLPPP